MANQDELINLQTLNLREDKATSEGTRAVRYLVQRLQEAYGNPALGPTVQALLQGQLVGTSQQGDPQQGEADKHKEKGPLSTGDQEREPPPKVTHVERSPKRQRSVSSSSSEESGRSRRGRFHRSRTKQSPALQDKGDKAEEPPTRRRGVSPSAKKSQ